MSYSNTFPNSLDEAMSFDSVDPLHQYRDEFLIPPFKNGSSSVYLCGNSLGLQPKKAKDYINQELKDWAELGVEGHLHAKSPWLSYHEQLTGFTAELVGALPEEVVNMNGLTVNLHLLMVSFYRPVGKKKKILAEKGSFPSDRYAIVSHLESRGNSPEDLIEIEPDKVTGLIKTENILSIIEEKRDEIALILLGGVNYYTGQYLDIEKITLHAQKHGISCGFDLAHAAGNIPLKLHEWQVDFAAWCSYKYLNGGPGSVSGVFIHSKHHTNPSIPRYAGWWGHDKSSRFKMGPDFIPIPTTEGWQLSNAPVLLMAPLRASLEIFHQAGIARLRNKSLSLTGTLFTYLNNSERFTQLGLKILTPEVGSERGCQISIQTGSNGKDLFNKLSASGIICDWREPDVIRIAPVPLYNSFEDVYRFAQILLN